MIDMISDDLSWTEGTFDNRCSQALGRGPSLVSLAEFEGMQTALTDVDNHDHLLPLSRSQSLVTRTDPAAFGVSASSEPVQLGILTTDEYRSD